MYRFKIGLARSIMLIYYRSDGAFKICCKRAILEKLREYIFIYRRKTILYELPTKQLLGTTDPLERQVFSLLIEKQRIQRKIRESVRSLKLVPLVFIASSLAIYAYSGDLLLSIVAGFTAASLSILLPRFSGRPKRLMNRISYPNYQSIGGGLNS